MLSNKERKEYERERRFREKEWERRRRKRTLISLIGSGILLIIAIALVYMWATANDIGSIPEAFDWFRNLSGDVREADVGTIIESEG